MADTIFEKSLKKQFLVKKTKTKIGKKNKNMIK